MGDPITTAAVIGGAIRMFTGVVGAGETLGIFGGGQKQQAAAQPQAPKVPTGPATLKDVSKFERPLQTEAPAFLGMGGQGLSNLQQRSAIATGGVSSEDPRFRDPATKDFYQNLVFSSLVGESGAATGAPLPIERQYLRDVFGVTPLGSTTESFLSAFARA